MNVSVVNRTPPVLQKSAKRSPPNSGKQGNSSGDIVLHMTDFGTNTSGAGEAVDKKA